MGNLFNYDNKFFQGFNKVIDCFYISILWLVFSIPIVTAGAAASATYYTVNKVLRGGRGYVWRSFWESFKQNFKQATICWLICLAVSTVLGWDAYIMYQMLQQGDKMGPLFYVFVIFLAFMALWICYLFPYIARFANTTKAVMKNAAIIAILNLPKTLIIGVIVTVFCLVIYIIPVLIILLPAFMMWSINGILEKVFRKYMSPEDLEKEKEYDMESQR